MSHQYKAKDPNGSKAYEIQLTKDQRHALAKILPAGCSLELMPKNKKDLSQKHPSKKIFTNDGNAIKKNGFIPDSTPNSAAISEAKTPSAKWSLRDNRKKSQSYLEDRFDTIPTPTASSKQAKPMADGAKKCMNLLQRLKKHNCAGPFLIPVDVEGLGLYDYYDLVPEPMDLSTVEKKLKNGEYVSVHEFGADIRKIWSNAFTYNAEGSSIYQMTARMSAYFEKIFKEIEDVQFNDKVKSLENQLKKLSEQLLSLTQPQAPIANSKAAPNRSGTKMAKSPSVIMEEPMSIQEKKVLCDNIKKLPADSLRGVWEIVSKGLPNTMGNKEELVFDIDALPVRVTRELEKFVRQRLGAMKPNKSKKQETSKSSHVAIDKVGYDPQQHYYQQVAKQNYQSTIQSQHMMQGHGGPQFDELKRMRDDDAESKSSDSSFISDSESGSDNEKKHKAKPVT